MATSVRGPGGSRPGFASFRSSARVTAPSGKFGWGHTNAFGKRQTGTKAQTTGTTTAVPTAWKQCSNSFFHKMSSFRALYNQTKGPAKLGRPSPATLNAFAGWINKGAIIQTVTAQQVTQWAKNQKKSFNTDQPSPTACKNVLCARFGKNAIKAVVRTKSGSFLVATAAQVNGRPFCFPK